MSSPYRICPQKIPNYIQDKVNRIMDYQFKIINLVRDVEEWRPELYDTIDEKMGWSWGQTVNHQPSPDDIATWVQGSYLDFLKRLLRQAEIEDYEAHIKLEQQKSLEAQEDEAVHA